MTRPNNKNRSGNEGGNAFFMILIAIILFAALAFTFSKGVQQGGENISNRQAQLAASDIVTYAQKIERAVQSVMALGNSESDISFENDTVTGYANGNCTPANKCEIFRVAGAGAMWQKPPSDANNGQAFFFGSNQVHPQTEADDPLKRDLVMLVPVKTKICDEINKMTSKEKTWSSPDTPNTTVKFTGDFAVAPGTGISWTTGTDNRPAGCFCVGGACNSGDPHYFYYTLYSRG